MLCENCKAKPATTHFKQIIGGALYEHHYCSDCAADLGLGFGAAFSALPDDFGKLIGSLFGEAKPHIGPAAVGERCSLCGMSFEEITHGGMVGCDQCYRTFLPKLLPWIQKIHGKTRHVGRIPASAGKAASVRLELERLETALQQAIDAQEFEQAAVLRDQIGELRKGGEPHAES